MQIFRKEIIEAFFHLIGSFSLEKNKILSGIILIAILFCTVFPLSSYSNMKNVMLSIKEKQQSKNAICVH